MATIPVNANSAIIDTNQDAQFVQLNNRSLAEIISSGNNVQVYQSKENVYVEAVQINPTQQFITQSVNNVGGSDYQVQFAYDGQFEGSSNFTYDPMSSTMSVPRLNSGNFTIPNVATINGGFLQTDANGRLSWAIANGAGNGSPGGANTQIQYNNNGLFGGSANFTFDTATNRFTLNGTVAGNWIPNVSNTYNLGNSTNRWKDLYLSNNSLYLGNTKLSTDGSNSVNTADLFINDTRFVRLAVTNTPNSAIIFGGNAPSGLTQPIVQLGSNVNAVVQIGSSANSNITATANGVVLPSNVSIPSGGTLTITGSDVVGGTFSNITINNATISNSNVSSINNGNSNVTVTANSNVTVGVAGTANVLTITGNANIGTIANAFTSNNYILGNGNTTISTTRWIGASTNQTGDIVLYQIPAANIASVDYHVTATQGSSSRQVSKLLAVNLGTTTNYVEYGSMWVGPQIADIYVTQAGGNIQLYSNAFTGQNIQYNIVLTIYNN